MVPGLTEQLKVSVFDTSIFKPQLLVQSGRKNLGQSFRLSIALFDINLKTLRLLSSGLVTMDGNKDIGF